MSRSTIGFKLLGETGSSFNTWSTVSIAVAAWNGGWPTSIAYKVEPRA